MTKPAEVHRTRDLEKTKHNILDAGRKEFARYGLQGARVDRIAHNSGANKYMIYYIFGSKEDLYLATLESLWETKTATLDAPIMQGPVTVETLVDLASRAMQVFIDNQEAARIVLHDLVSGGDYLRMLKNKRPELFATFDAASMMLDQMMNMGMIRRIDPYKAILVMAMIIVSYAVISPHFGIVVSTNSPGFATIADDPEWKEFIGEVIKRTLGIEQKAQ